MTKIINGKKYNTETAEMIGEYYTEGISKNDFNYFEETLFRKKTGEFFLYGNGGAMTKYSRVVGNSSCGDERIIPLTLDEAKTWAEKYCEVDKYEEIFGEVEE